MFLSVYARVTYVTHILHTRKTIIYKLLNRLYIYTDHNNVTIN